MNRDGRLDLILNRQGNFAYYTGDSEFDFAIEQAFDGPLLDTLTGAMFLALGEFNTDGVVDLLAFGGDGAMLYIGDRDNSFAHHDGGELGFGTPVPAVTLWFDANRDGVLDLFTLHQGTNILYLGTGVGTYVARYPGTSIES